jgi:hypothetical protein
MKFNVDTVMNPHPSFLGMSVNVRAIRFHKINEMTF